MCTVEGKNTWSLKGLIIHPTLALSTNGECFGLIDLQVYSRAAGIRRTSYYEHVRIPIHEKESYRWIKSIGTSQELTINKVKTITVADREADIYELFHKSQKLTGSFLIRACKDRIVIDKKSKKTKKSCKISEKLSNTKTSGTYQIKIPRKGNNPARIATIKIKYTSIISILPIRRGAAKIEILNPVKLYTGSTVEENPPKDVVPLFRILLTNIAVNSINDALEKIEYYKLRWTIETYFNTLKSGFKIECKRLNRGIKMKRFVSLICVLATRVMRLVHFERQNTVNQKTIITMEFSIIENKIISSIDNNKKKLSKLNIYESVRILAHLGGFLGRGVDGDPGITSIWRGLQKLNELEKYYLILEGLVAKT